MFLGQVVYWRQSRSMRIARSEARLTPRDVVKIGRRWVTLDSGDRFEPGEGEGPFPVDNGDYSSYADIFLSTEAAAAHDHREAAWRRLVELARGEPPAHVTGEQIDAFAALIEGLRREV